MASNTQCFEFPDQRSNSAYYVYGFLFPSKYFRVFRVIGELFRWAVSRSKLCSKSGMGRYSGLISLLGIDFAVSPGEFNPHKFCNRWYRLDISKLKYQLSIRGGFVTCTNSVADTATLHGIRVEQAETQISIT